ncbi:shikimate kinase [Paracoccus sanguinis]|uniref:shikimate kinase n=1 Tax=Paracoccus sanguinis TaxID=1545044 RepID=UPI0022B187FC|nr:shikimate kinase [Paracoccus sanguinis]
MSCGVRPGPAASAGSGRQAKGAGVVKRSIVLVGIMGAGKSAVGAELARRLGVSLRDTDAEIVRAAAMTIPEIFARDGEAFFRARESEVLARVLRGKPGIVSTGGGAWMSAENRAQVAARGVSVWLDVPLGVLWNRVRQRPTRPLLQTPDPRGTLARLLAERAPSYALAEITVPVRAENSVDDTAARVLEAIRTHRPEILEPA